MLKTVFSLKSHEINSQSFPTNKRSECRNLEENNIVKIIQEHCAWRTKNVTQNSETKKKKTLKEIISNWVILLHTEAWLTQFLKRRYFFFSSIHRDFYKYKKNFLCKYRETFQAPGKQVIPGEFNSRRRHYIFYIIWEFDQTFMEKYLKIEKREA